MKETLSEILRVGGKANTLGRADEVVQKVLKDKKLLDELYNCIFDEDAWVRMRAIDSLEKVCRVHPEWLEENIDKIINELTSSDQPSIQWHLAEIFNQVKLSDTQQKVAISWLKKRLETTDVDWIVASNIMKTLARFYSDGKFSRSEFIKLLKIQKNHKSKAVKKRVGKLLSELQDS